MSDYIGTSGPQQNPPIQESSRLDSSSVLNAVLIVLAVIGAITIAGALGMWALHVGMMNGIGVC